MELGAQAQEPDVPAPTSLPQPQLKVPAGLHLQMLLPELQLLLLLLSRQLKLLQPLPSPAPLSLRRLDMQLRELVPALPNLHQPPAERRVQSPTEALGPALKMELAVLLLLLLPLLLLQERHALAVPPVFRHRCFLRRRAEPAPETKPRGWRDGRGS